MFNEEMHSAIPLKSTIQAQIPSIAWVLSITAEEIAIVGLCVRLKIEFGPVFLSSKNDDTNPRISDETQSDI